MMQVGVGGRGVVPLAVQPSAAAAAERAPLGKRDAVGRGHRSEVLRVA